VGGSRAVQRTEPSMRDAVLGRCSQVLTIRRDASWPAQRSHAATDDGWGEPPRNARAETPGRNGSSHDRPAPRRNRSPVALGMGHPREPDRRLAPRRLRRRDHVGLLGTHSLLKASAIGGRVPERRLSLAMVYPDLGARHDRQRRRHLHIRPLRPRPRRVHSTSAIHLREDAILPALDGWIATLYVS
jgi:hypothetical protein